MDVWGLLDEETAAAAAIIASSRNTTETTILNKSSVSDAASASSLSRLAVQRFLSKLGVEVVVHPRSPSREDSSDNKHHHHHHHYNDVNARHPQQEQSHLPLPPYHALGVDDRYDGRNVCNNNDMEATARSHDDGRPRPPLMSLISKVVYQESSSSPSLDQYIRQMSEDTASVRCRLEVCRRRNEITCRRSKRCRHST